MNAPEEREFTLHEELLKIWTDNPLSSVATDAWGHAILTTLAKNFPEDISLTKTVQQQVYDSARLDSSFSYGCPFKAFFKPQTWAAGSPVVEILHDDVKHLLENNRVLTGSVRILPELDPEEQTVNLHIFCAKLEGENPDGN